MSTEQTQATTEVRDDSAYRRGYQHGFTEAHGIIQELIAQGLTPGKINQLIAIYQDWKVRDWRMSNLDKLDPQPAFNIQELEEFAATHHGYDWLLLES